MTTLLCLFFSLICQLLLYSLVDSNQPNRSAMSLLSNVMKLSLVLDTKVKGYHENGCQGGNMNKRGRFCVFCEA